MMTFQDVSPKAGTPGVESQAAPAQGGAAPGPGASMLTFLPIILMVVVMLFMSSRRQKKEQEARGKLKRGDRVLTQSGLIGELVELDDRIAKVKIAPGTTVQVLASALSPFDAAEKKADKSLDDLKEAKAGADKK